MGAGHHQTEGQADRIAILITCPEIDHVAVGRSRHEVTKQGSGQRGKGRRGIGPEIGDGDAGMGHVGPPE